MSSFQVILYCPIKMAERMSEMEAEALAKMVELEGELVELRKQKEDLENMNSQVSIKDDAELRV